MKRSDLIDTLAERFPHLHRKDVELAVNTLLDTISDAIAQGRRVEIRGFGNFELTLRRAYTGHHPRTGASIQIPERRMLHFKAGKALLETVNTPPATTSSPSNGI